MKTDDVKYEKMCFELCVNLTYIGSQMNHLNKKLLKIIIFLFNLIKK